MGNSQPPTADELPQLLAMDTPVDRTSFFSLFKQAIEAAQPSSAPVLMLVELAGLKAIAQHHDQACQRALAELAAQRLAEVLGGNGFVCTLRENRFSVLVASDGSHSVDAISTALLAGLAKPIVAGGVTLSPEATLGVAQWGHDGKTVEEMFVAADLAVHAAQAGSAAGPWASAGQVAPEVVSEYRPRPIKVLFGSSPLARAVV